MAVEDEPCFIRCCSAWDRRFVCGLRPVRWTVVFGFVKRLSEKCSINAAPFFFDRRRQIESIKRQNRGCTLHIQTVYKRIKTKLQKRKKKLKKLIIMPKNSEKRENLTPKTAETTLEETEKRVPHMIPGQ